MKDSDLIINTNPKSMFSEAIKNVRTNLAFASVDKKIKVILVTSPEVGDGKSFITANLSVAFAQEGKNVLIVDCDLRKGRQHVLFDLVNNTNGGLSNCILNFDEKEDIKKYISKTSIKNVEVITAGPVPPNPLELLSSNSFEKILTELKKHYDIIVLDCPPVLGISDTSIVTKYTDANLLVVGTGKTHIELIKEAKKAFDAVGAPITGVVINRANVKDKSYYGYYCNDYYSEKENN